MFDGVGKSKIAGHAFPTRRFSPRAVPRHFPDPFHLAYSNQNLKTSQTNPQVFSQRLFGPGLAKTPCLGFEKILVWRWGWVHEAGDEGFHFLLIDARTLTVASIRQVAGLDSTNLRIQNPVQHGI